MSERLYVIGDYISVFGCDEHIQGIADYSGAKVDENVHYLIQAENINPVKIRRFVYKGEDQYIWKKEGYEINWKELKVGELYAWIGQKEVMQVISPLDRELDNIRKEIYENK